MGTPVKCFNCNGDGHFARECPSTKNQNGNENSASAPSTPQFWTPRRNPEETEEREFIKQMIQEKREEQARRRELEEQRRFDEKLRAEMARYAEATKAEVMAVVTRQYLGQRDEARREELKRGWSPPPRRRDDHRVEEDLGDVDDIDLEIRRLELLWEEAGWERAGTGGGKLTSEEMSGSSYRDNRDYRRSSERDRTYDDGRYGGRDAARERGRDGRRDRYPKDERSTGYREGGRRPQGTCFECGEPGHYRNQCPMLIGESSTQRGRSASPGYKARGVVKRPSSEERALRKQLEDLTSTMASMKSFIDAEQTRKDKEERQRKESEKREQEEAEQLQRETKEQLARERRACKKEDKKKKEVEDRAALRKELRMDMRLHMGAMCEGVHDHIIQTMLSEGKKGKAKTTEYY
ncbi:hypothetical protein CBR_g6275 [Chara braunii]|uniref:CCHC-type domain-containing protein n=1 Tax=Chara braunii TaxID=69332 RepID=A0A388KJB7_CHABU|nr:hypothetical protein CBR_g6275 [Chara braunii]|eukprot:GBG70144.1 hypothetical protein CBR_g6275 [Chara braunii]